MKKGHSRVIMTKKIFVELNFRRPCCLKLPEKRYSHFLTQTFYYEYKAILNIINTPSARCPKNKDSYEYAQKGFKE